MGETIIRAGIYTRLSKDPTGTKPNIAGQERRCRDLTASRGWHVEEVYVDRDRTAAGRDPYRPDYARMCDDLKSGRLDAVVALDQDRLVREPYELELLLRLCEDVGVEHVVTSQGEITANGVLYARIRASVDADEIKKMKERHRRVQEDIARAGRWGGGYRAFGYSPDHMSLDDREAALLRDAARRIIAGESADAITREWNTAGVKTVLGKPWRGKSLRRILASPTITGLRVHHGEIVGDAVWPAVIDRATWEAAKDAIASRPEARVGSPPRTYLLSGGLLRCALCGESMRARPRSDHVRAYVCVKEKLDGATVKGCGGVRVTAEPLEELVLESVMAAIEDGALARIRAADVADDDDRRHLVADLQVAERKLAQAEERYLLGDVSRRAFLTVKEQLTGKADALRRQLARSQRQAFQEDLPAAPDELRQWWGVATIDRKRTFLGLFIESVAVKRASRRGAPFSKERVEIAWLV